jgi:hypothetical protein
LLSYLSRNYSHSRYMPVGERTEVLIIQCLSLKVKIQMKCSEIKMGKLWKKT